VQRFCLRSSSGVSQRRRSPDNFSSTGVHCDRSETHHSSRELKSVFAESSSLKGRQRDGRGAASLVGDRQQVHKSRGTQGMYRQQPAVPHYLLGEVHVHLATRALVLYCECHASPEGRNECSLQPARVRAGHSSPGWTRMSSE
jgi:hypothetical protein